MIVEHRTYRLAAGRLNEYLGHYEAEGLGIQSRYLGDPLGWYVVDVGPLNTVVHLWQYDSHNERERRRKQLSEDPAWIAFLPKVTPLLVDMRSMILTPAPFFSRSKPN
ncbi:NIPSNAP family protein [Agrobacterium vitis]|nr:NIPSNAP family protein [Allorhizobium ampelinum]